MKKTVQIVTIPLNKEDWGNNELLKRQPPQIDQYIIADKESNPVTECIWQAQQLLVLSDDNTKDVLCLWDDNVIDICLENNENVEYGNPKKIIASYPQLPGTLPISKETVQAWIDSGTPEEGTVNLIEGHYIPSTYDKPDNWVDFDVPRPEVDTKSNLLLEFGKKIINTLPYPELMKGISEYYKDVKIVEEKPSIPTDEEIKKKAVKNSSSYRAKAAAIISYTEGYKQALKDLGHE
jgi:hypothetical protein